MGDIDEYDERINNELDKADKEIQAYVKKDF